MNTRTEILTIGTEILQGQVVNTNAAYIAEKLTEEGVAVGWMTTVSDDRPAILDACHLAAKRARAVIITGGLGPTPDDLTKSCLAEYLHDKIILRHDLLDRVEKLFADRGMKLPPQSRNQAEFPQKAQVIPNPKGTAVGIHYAGKTTEWFSLPGVPMEMRLMVDDYVIPRLQKIGLGGQVAVRLLRTTGLGESFLMERMSQLQKAAELVEVAFLPRFSGVDIKLTARIGSPKELVKRLDRADKLLAPDLESYLYSRGESLPEAVGILAKQKGWKIAVAESCTGGLISKWITDTPGSSDYFERGLVSYSNESKNELYGIRASYLRKLGAVHEVIAKGMAQGLVVRSLADLTVAVTGIAGPGGGTEEKPVGTVYIASADRSGWVEVQRFQFWGSRDNIRKRTAAAALKMLWDRLQKA